MRPINSNERKLLTVFGVSLFLILNVIAAKWFFAQTQNIQSRIRSLKSTAGEYEVALQERPHWEARQAWLNASPMAPYEGPSTDSHFAEDVQHSLVQSGLLIEAQQLHEAVLQGDIAEVTLDLTVKGRLEEIVRWLQLAQQPGKYFVIRSFTLKRFDEGSTMSARITAGRLFRQGSLASTP